jgi:hypothetical protein
MNIILSISLILLQIFGMGHNITLFQSVNMQGLELQCEPNPGGILQTDANINDVSVSISRNYALLTSNSQDRAIWANAYLVKKYTDTINGKPIVPINTSLQFSCKLHIVPSMSNVNENPQQVDCCILYWDGSNRHEITLMWELNPWDSSFGYILSRSSDGIYINTGVFVQPDTSWHTFKIVGSFINDTVSYAVIDGIRAEINHPLWSHAQVGWGTGKAIWADIDTCSIYPIGADGTFHTYFCATYFSNYVWTQI